MGGSAPESGDSLAELVDLWQRRALGAEEAFGPSTGGMTSRVGGMAESMGWCRGYGCPARLLMASRRRRLLASSLHVIDTYGGQSCDFMWWWLCGSQTGVSPKREGVQKRTGVSLNHGGRSHFLSSWGAMWWRWQYRRDTVKNGPRQPEYSDLERRGILQTCEQRPDLFIREVLEIKREDGGKGAEVEAARRQSKKCRQLSTHNRV